MLNRIAIVDPIYSLLVILFSIYWFSVLVYRVLNQAFLSLPFDIDYRRCRTLTNADCGHLNVSIVTTWTTRIAVVASNLDHDDWWNRSRRDLTDDASLTTEDRSLVRRRRDHVCASSVSRDDSNRSIEHSPTMCQDLCHASDRDDTIGNSDSCDLPMFHVGRVVTTTWNVEHFD